MKIAQILASGSWGEVTPAAITRGLGGRETAMVSLAREWAKLGHEVTNFVQVENGIRFDSPNKRGILDTRAPGDIFDIAGYHEYVPLSLAKPMLATFAYDACIAWECPAVFADQRIVDRQPVRLTHMQVAHFLAGQMEAAEEFSTGVVALSQWAKEFLLHSGLDMDESMIEIRPNGVDISKYPENKLQNKRKHTDTLRMVYSSSPDRGLLHLLEGWGRIRKSFSDAKLYVGYGVKPYTEQVKWAHSAQGEQSVELNRLMTQPGIYDIGTIGQQQLASLQMSSNMWVYPCDTIQATETGCITAVENMAAGNPAIITDTDCLESEFGDYARVLPTASLYTDPDNLVAAIEDMWDNPVAYKAHSEAGRKFAETRDWGEIAPAWMSLFQS